MVRLYLMGNNFLWRVIDKKQAFSTPEFYSMVAALMVCVQLDPLIDFPLELNLNQYALSILENYDIQEKIAWYFEIPDTADLAKKLLTYVE